jgi:hypothetical protein
MQSFAQTWEGGMAPAVLHVHAPSRFEHILVTTIPRQQKLGKISSQSELRS